MVKVIERPRWSFWRYQQVYQCDLPDDCSRPIEKIASFFRAYQGRDWEMGPDYIRFSRGSVLGSMLSPLDRHQLHEAFIRVEPTASARRVTCEYRIWNPVGVHTPPWGLHNEVKQLEQYLNGEGTGTGLNSGWPERWSRWLGVVKRFVLIFPFRVLYIFYRIFSWMRYRATRRFTPAGVLMLIGLLAAAMMGVDTETTVAYQAFAPLLFLLLVAILFSFFFRVRFSAVRRLPRFGTVDQPFRYAVELKNLSGKTQRDLELAENLADPRPGFAEWQAVQWAREKEVLLFRFNRRRARPFKRANVKSAPVPIVQRGAETEAHIEMTPLRRGTLRFNGLTFARPDPLGLFRGFSRMALSQSMLVLPKRYLLPSVALPGTMKYQEGGVALAASVGQSDEFVALRDYRRGDPLRHIHWRSWAKTGKPIVKEFEDEFFVRHALVLDTFTPNPRSEAFEDAVSIAASFASSIQIQESLLDLLFVETRAYCFTAGRGLAHSDQMLEILASVNACSDRPFRTLEHLVLDHVTLVSGCICVLLAWDRERHEFIEKLQALGLPLLVLVVTEPGRNQALAPGPMRDQAGRFHVLEAGQIEAGLARIAL
jgi:Protein of unknown function DUF58